MTTLVRRLLFNDRPKSPAFEAGRDTRHGLLEYVMDLGSRTNHFDELTSRISDFVFPEQAFDADIGLAHLYLELEYYLIYKDPRYIGTAGDLRKKVKARFPDLTAAEPFSWLFESEKNQEVLLSRLFILYVLHILASEKPNDKLASTWIGVIGRGLKPKSGLNVVERINLQRKLREKTREMYTEICETYGNDFADKLLYSCFTEFSEYFSHVKAVESISELVPESQEESEDIPVRKLIALNSEEGIGLGKQSSQTYHKSIMENMLDGFLIIDGQGNVLDYNGTAQKALKFNETLLVKSTVYEYLPEILAQALKHDLEKTDPAIPSAVVGKRSEVSFRGVDGTEVDYEVSITNNYTEGLDTYSVFLKNVSNKKNMLDAIKNAKVNAERSAKAKATFLSNMSHEIRTPLNVILGLSELLSKSDLEDEEMLRKNIDGIDFSARNLLSIVNDILDFSKIEAGKLTLQSIDFNLRKVVETLTNGFEIKAREKGLELKTIIEDDVPDIVIGDQYRLNQILTNLIGNAIKFTKKGKIIVRVQLKSNKKDEVNLQFSVKDTGVGISKDHLDRIFECFYQIDDQEIRDVSGTGLGLAITKQLIDLQEGNLNIESKVGKGSSFEFTLPFRPSNLKSLNDSIKTYVRQDKKLEGLRVLVAEDNPMNQFYIKQLLEKFKVAVDIVENGKEAVDTYERSEKSYDLIFMDMHMPVMNGTEAISVIRQMDQDSVKKVPIVACSADVFPEARKSAIKAGIDFYLTKPLSEDAIKEVLFWLISDDDVKPELSVENTEQAETDKKPQSKNVDLNALNDTFDGDVDFIISLLEVFIQTTPEDYKSLRQCIAREYYTRASSLAHKMKSSFMNLGMTVHGHHLQQIEVNVVKSGGISEAKKHLSAFSQMYTKALLEVNQVLIEMRHKKAEADASGSK